jgi:hypothetical protein
MNKSDQIGKLAEALSKAQGAMKNAVKDSNNPFFKSKYADLASVSDACRMELAMNGLAVSQLPEIRDTKLVLHYVLMHQSGEWISGELEMTPVKSDPQGIGSAITYARRYTLASIAGVATEDDDGNAASGNASNSKTREDRSNVERIKEDIPIVMDGNRETPKDEDLISKEQAKKLHMRFRDELREELKPKADDFLRDWLGTKLYLDASGTPSADAIPKDLFSVVGKEAVKHAKTL